MILSFRQQTVGSLLCRLRHELCGFLVALVCWGCSQRPSPPPSVRSDPFWVMGTVAGIALPTSDAHRLDDAVAGVESVFRTTERLLSRYRDDSELSRVNQAAGTEAVSVSRETFETVKLALAYARQTGGAFDPTVTPLVDLWQSASTTGVPDAELIARNQTLIGYAKVETDPVRETMFLPHAGMRLDLGGIAKGTALDRAAKTLRLMGYDHFLIDLGGDVWCEGRPDGLPAWRVGVRHPFRRDAIVGIVHVPPGNAIVTSGQYERFIEIEGERFGHIIDPRTGYPAHGMAGVTVIAESAGGADALSTALFVMGEDGAAAFLGQTDGVDAILIPDRQPIEIGLTPGLAGRFEPLPEYRDAVVQIDRLTR